MNHPTSFQNQNDRNPFHDKNDRTLFQNRNDQISFQNNGKLKLLIMVGTRPEIIRLSAVIRKCRKYFDTILAHTGQNYEHHCEIL